MHICPEPMLPPLIRLFLFAAVSGHGQGPCSVVPQNTCYTLEQSTALFFNCSCDLSLRDALLEWIIATPLRPFIPFESIWQAARLPDLGLYDQAMADYALQGSNLIVKDPGYSDAGKYMCFFTSDFGNTRREAEAIVLGKI